MQVTISTRLWPLARSCGSAWAEGDALTHLAEVRTRLGDSGKATAVSREGGTLSRRLPGTTSADPNPSAWVDEEPEPAGKPRPRRASEGAVMAP